MPKTEMRNQLPHSIITHTHNKIPGKNIRKHTVWGILLKAQMSVLNGLKLKGSQYQK